MSLDVDVTLRRHGFSLSARFVAETGVTALFGPSGAGKTTLALLVAGLVQPSAGHIVLDGIVLTDTAARLALPPHRRRIAAVFQDGRLFPHLTVRQNLLYGAWFNGADRSRLDAIVDLLGVGGVLARRPQTLSGGEQRRVAIGRALLSEPRLLILDEPLTGLDTARKEEILPYLERLRDDLRMPMIYVSHALSEVVRLADTLVLLERGAVTAAGRLSDVMVRPASEGGPFETGAVIQATVLAIDAEDRLATIAFSGGQLLVPAADLIVGAGVRIHVRARDVAIATVRPQDTSILNVLPGVIVAVTGLPESIVDVVIDVSGTQLVARISRRSSVALGLESGKPVYAMIKGLAFDRRPGAFS